MDVRPSKGAAEASEDEKRTQMLIEFEKILTPSAEDIAYKLKMSELVELCHRIPCHVDMTKWNAVHDYELRFARENRLEKRSTTGRIRLLTRAVNMHMKRSVYTDEEIQRDWLREWEFRKLQGLVLLSMWRSSDEENVPLSSVSAHRRPVTTDNNTESSEDETNNGVGDWVSKGLQNIAGLSESESQVLASQTIIVLDSQSQPLAEPVLPNSKNEETVFNAVDKFYTDLNSESMSIQSRSQLLNSEELVADSNRNTAELLLSQEFASIPLTATSTQEL